MCGFLSRLKDGTAFQIKFKDRRGGGEVLGTALRFAVKKNKQEKKKILVLGIPRGGVIVADIVATKLGADFDVVVAKKLTAPDNKENAVGALMFDGSVYLDDFMVSSLKIPVEYIESEKAHQAAEIERRVSAFRPAASSGDSSKTCRDYDLKGRTVIIVDDGIATGATVIAVARWARKQEPARLIIAAPVAQPQVVDLLKGKADAVEIISTPANFGSVNQFYQNFDQATEERVIEILKSRSLL